MTELDVKTHQLADMSNDLIKAQAVAADLESQLRVAGDASTVRALEKRLRQTVLIHRQLIRKVRRRQPADTIWGVCRGKPNLHHVTCCFVSSTCADRGCGPGVHVRTDNLRWGSPVCSPWSNAMPTLC